MWIIMNKLYSLKIPIAMIARHRNILEHISTATAVLVSVLSGVPVKQIICTCFSIGLLNRKKSANQVNTL